MKRKIIKLGQATYVMSLPTAWIQEHQLQKGDYIEVEEEDGSLLLRTEKTAKGKTLTLDIRKLNDKLVRGYLSVAYSLGYETIEVIHESILQLYTPRGKSTPVLRSTEYLQELVNRFFINMEIVEQSEKRTVIKDLGGGVSEESAKNIFQRILFLLSQAGEEVSAGLQQQDKEKLRILVPMFANVRKFLLYYARLLSLGKVSKVEFRLRNNIVSYLTSVNSAYKTIVELTLGEKEIQYSKAALHTLELIQAHFQDMKELCLEFSQEKAVRFLQSRQLVWEEGYAQRGTAKDIPLYWCYGTLMSAMWYVVREIYGLQVERV